MTYIEVTGTVNQDGILEAKVPAETPIGKVNVIILVDSEVDDGATWDESIRNSKEMLHNMAKKALTDHQAGLTREFDPDVDLADPDEADS